MIYVPRMNSSNKSCSRENLIWGYWRESARDPRTKVPHPLVSELSMNHCLARGKKPFWLKKAHPNVTITPDAKMALVTHSTAQPPFAPPPHQMVLTISIMNVYISIHECHLKNGFICTPLYYLGHSLRYGQGLY